MLGQHLPKGAATGQQSAGTSPDMTWHNGAVQNSTYVRPIFWGSSWSSYSGDKITGIDSWYAGVGGTNYMGTNTEYTGSGGTKVTRTVTSAPSYVDASAGPNHAPKTTDIQNEVCKVLAARGEAPRADGYYPVYVDLPRGHAGYCAWHSYGTCAGVNVQFGFFFNLDGDPGCDPSDASNVHSQGLEAIANVSGHELSEMATDPRNGGWWDSSGNENGDKCAWTFSSGDTGAGNIVFANGTTWKIQGNWSNAAYNANAGYGRGCIDGN